MAKTRAESRPSLRAAAAALLVLASSLASTLASPAAAQWRFGGGRADGRHEGRGAYQERGRGGWGGERPVPGGRGYGGYGDGAYGRAPRAGPPMGGDGRAWRRGETLPNGYRGATVPDPGRYHLRRPPNGYDWVGDNRNAYLMQRSTGMVLDSVPGAYEPPPPYRGRRR